MKKTFNDIATIVINIACIFFKYSKLTKNKTNTEAKYHEIFIPTYSKIDAFE